MSGRLLLIGVWGLPSAWHYASYQPLLPPGDVSRWGRPSEWSVSGKHVNSNATLAAVASTLIDAGWEVSVAVYGLDTLASPAMLQGNRVPQSDPRKDIIDDYNSLVESYAKSPPRNYGEVVDRARNVLELFATHYFEVTLDGKAVSLHLEVLPGIGRFPLSGGGKRWVYLYQGSPSNMHAMLELSIYRLLEKVEPEAVILDTSHGINFMPLLASTAVHSAARAYSAARGVELCVALVNSDPVNTPGQEALVHLVESRCYSAKPLELLLNTSYVAHGTPAAARMLVRARPPEHVQRLIGEARRLWRSYGDLVESLVKAARYGLALYMLHTLSTVDTASVRGGADRLALLIEEAARTRDVEVDEDKGTVRVSQGYALDSRRLLDTVYLLRSLALLAGMASETASGEATGMVHIGCLREFAERIGVEEPALTILKNELDSITSRVRVYWGVTGEEPGKPVPYQLVLEALSVDAYHILDPEERKKVLDKLREKDWKCEPDKRNFYAHAGLERTTINVSLDASGEVVVGYRGEGCMEKIRSLLKA